MNPLIWFVVAEIVKLTMQRLEESGKLGDLTEDSAKKIIADYAAGLPTIIPSPEDLEDIKHPV